LYFGPAGLAAGFAAVVFGAAVVEEVVLGAVVVFGAVVLGADVAGACAINATEQKEAVKAVWRILGIMEVSLRFYQRFAQN
jgi:hypothetical protein